MILPGLPDAKTVPRAVASWAAADAKFAEILAASKSPAAALARWSLELLAADRAPEAIPAIRAALALSPGDPLLWSNYGAALNEGNLPDEAVACLEHSLKLLPKQPDTWLLLGMVGKKMGNPARAEEAYHCALEHEPRSIAAWQLLAVLKEEQKDFSTAIHCLKACVEVGGPTPPLMAYIGKLSYNLGKFAEASDAYGQAAIMDSTNAVFRQMAARCAFIKAMILGEEMEAAIANFKNALSPGNEEISDMLKTAFSQLSGFGYTEAAARVGMKQLELHPADNSLKYLVAAVKGDSALNRSPREYVVEHFDSFAEGFEAKLVGTLGYDIPEKLCTAIKKFAPAGRMLDSLDAGCGTGLCGPLLRTLSRHLTGIDISPKMLEQARRKGVYDETVCEDLPGYLEHSGKRFDLMAAADLMIYFGDLSPVISGAAKALRPGGLLAFSTESLNEGRYLIRPSGRFAHSPNYVREVAAENFELLELIETTVRLEANGRLAGNIFVFRRLAGV